MASKKRLSTLKHTEYFRTLSKKRKPEGDPHAMEIGSQERTRWFEQARAYLPNFDPAKVDPNKLEPGSVAWHLWCEWDECEEVMSLYWAESQADAYADYICQDPEDAHVRTDRLLHFPAKRHKPSNRTPRAKSRSREAA